MAKEATVMQQTNLRGFGGPLIDMTGAVDLHFHSYPCLFPRLADDLEVAISARDAGFRALLFKCHHENSVSRAYFLDGLIPGLRLFGGVVLNSYVGYMNPAAVEAALQLGGKAVWMPTVDAGYHAEVHGSTGRYTTQSGGRESAEGYWLTGDDGKLKPEVGEVLALVAECNAILGTAHLSPPEIVELVPRARKAGVEKLVITHPFYKVPNLDLDTLEELVKQGAIAEFEYCGISPMWHVAQIEGVVAAVERLGANNCTLCSDAGQRHNPIAPEALRVFAQSLFEKGIPEADVDRMIKTNPAALLDLDSDDAQDEGDQDRWAVLRERLDRVESSEPGQDGAGRGAERLSPQLVSDQA